MHSSHSDILKHPTLNKENPMKIITTPLLAFALLIVAGCSESNSNPINNQTQNSTQNEMASWVLTSEPQGAVSVTEAKSIAKEGDEIVIRGRIGGRPNPMDAASPVFTIVDLELEYCGQNTSDGCTSPWDYCCETPDTISTNSATIQVVSDDTVDLTSELEPLDEVILRGTVGPRTDERLLIIRANGVYRVQS